MKNYISQLNINYTYMSKLTIAAYKEGVPSRLEYSHRSSFPVFSQSILRDSRLTSWGHYHPVLRSAVHIYSPRPENFSGEMLKPRVDRPVSFILFLKRVSWNFTTGHIYRFRLVSNTVKTKMQGIGMNSEIVNT